MDRAVFCIQRYLEKRWRLRASLDVDVLKGGPIGTVHTDWVMQLPINADTSKPAVLPVRRLPLVACAPIHSFWSNFSAGDIGTVGAWVLTIKRVLRSKRLGVLALVKPNNVGDSCAVVCDQPGESAAIRVLTIIRPGKIDLPSSRGRPWCGKDIAGRNRTWSAFCARANKEAQNEQTANSQSEVAVVFHHQAPRNGIAALSRRQLRSRSLEVLRLLLRKVLIACIS